MDVVREELSLSRKRTLRGWLVYPGKVKSERGYICFLQIHEGLVTT